MYAHAASTQRSTRENALIEQLTRRQRVWLTNSPVGVERGRRVHPDIRCRAVELGRSNPVAHSCRDLPKSFHSIRMKEEEAHYPFSIQNNNNENFPRVRNKKQTLFQVEFTNAFSPADNIETSVPFVAAHCLFADVKLAGVEKNL